MALSKNEIWLLGLVVSRYYSAIDKNISGQICSMKQMQHLTDVKNLNEKLMQEYENAEVEQEREIEKTGNLFAEEG
jgi:F0F1-type ATP synthase gamma subunit